MIHANEWKQLNEDGKELFYKARKGIYPKEPDYMESPNENWDWNTFQEHYPDYDSLDRIEWIYGYGLTEKLFVPEKIDELHELYKKTTLQLAQEYITDSETLPPNQIERLVHEVDPELRKMLENNLSPSDPLIKQISAKFTFKIQNGLKILK